MIGKKCKQALCGTLLLGGLVGLSAPSYASQTLDQLIKIMHQNGSLTDAQYQQLLGAAHSDATADRIAQDKQQEQINQIQQSTSGSASGWWKKTKISGRMYYDFTNINNDRSGTKQSNSGTGFDLKRFYVSIDHKFNKTFSGDITTDFTYDSGAGATQLYIKKAYLDMNLDPAFDLRLGATDLPWIPFAEGVYGERYVENTLIDRSKYGTSSDWGLHAKGSFSGGMLNYAVSLVDGAGYKHPQTGSHTNTMDVEGRVDLKVNHFIFALGGYSGKLGKDVHGASTPHTATRTDAIVAYVGHPFRVGLEYFKATDFYSVTSATTDSADGTSIFASYDIAPQWGVFGRYDNVTPTNADGVASDNPTDHYYNIGVQYSPTKIVQYALVYKHDNANNGYLKTSNGTIGSLLPTSGNGTYNEVGVFGRFKW